MDSHNQINASKYAEVQSKILNGSPYKSTSKLSSSMKPSNNLSLIAKFQMFGQALNTIQYQTQKLTTDTNQSNHFCKRIAREVGEKQMREQNDRCKQQIKKYEKTFLYGKQQAEKRTESLWSDCKSLKSKQGSLKNLVNELRFKLDRLQKTLGYYCGTQNMELHSL